jgi:hypothetical protein
MKLNNAAPFTSSGILQFEDSKFTAYERDNGQVFTYYCTVSNYRGDQSLPSAAASASARLDSSQDGDPTLPSRDGFKNLLFNGFIGGAGVTVSGVANVVDDSDTTQDPFNFQPAIAPSTFAASSGTRLEAWTRWKYHQSGQVTVFPVHINNNEIKLAPPGSSGKQVGIKESLNAWSHATTIDRKLQAGQYVTVQVKVYCDAGVTPNGSFEIQLLQFNGGASRNALLRTRQTDDTMLEAASALIVSGPSIAAGTAANPLKVYATFHLDSSTTDRIETRFLWDSGTTSNLYIKEAMDNDGIEIAPWTADMGNIDMYYPIGQPTGTMPDFGDGSRVGIIQV